MKQIALIEESDFKSKDLFRAVMSQPAAGQQGINAAEMRQRIRLLDALDAADGVLLLEDADHALFARLIQAFPFQMAHRKVLSAIDDVVNAQAPAEKSQAA